MDQLPVINLNGAPVTVRVLAAIVTALETHGCVSVYGASIPNAGPGMGAMELGRHLQKVGYFDQTENEADGN